MKGCRSGLFDMFFKKIISTFLEYSKKNIHYEERLRQSAATTLLKPLLVLGKFLEIFQKFNKNSFQYKKHLWGVISQTYKRNEYICNSGRGNGVSFFFLIIFKKVQLLRKCKEQFFYWQVDYTALCCTAHTL